jgi:hypothetical protein
MANYTDLSTRFVYRLALRWSDFDALADNDAHVMENNWENGVTCVFFQAAAPTGWTKLTTVTGKALRIVSGTTGTAGTVGGDHDPATEITLAHTHSIAQSNHTHEIMAHQHYWYSVYKHNVGENSTRFDICYDENNFLRSLDYFSAAGASPGYGPAGAIFYLIGGPYNTDSQAHDHGDATDSRLSNITLAYANVIFCSKDTSVGYEDKKSDFSHNNDIDFEDLNELAANDEFNRLRITPAGTVGIFGSVVPSGWTKLTTQNGQLLRVVSGAGGGDGGSHDPAVEITLNHPHDQTSDPGSHAHVTPDHVHSALNSQDEMDVGKYFGDNSGIVTMESDDSTEDRTAYKGITTSSGAGTSSESGSHTHTPESSLINITLAHLNVNQASKNSTGSPASYTDMSSFFSDENLLAHQDMQDMADNDTYLKFHLMPSGSRMFFYQPTQPLNWTKMVAYDGRLLRVTSYSAGNIDGIHDPGDVIGLAHTHIIQPVSHKHNVLEHNHALDSGTVVAAPFTSGRTINPSPNFLGHHPSTKLSLNAVYSIYSYPVLTGTIFSGSSPTEYYTDGNSWETDINEHDHGGATGSALSNITLAHANVLICQKN